MATTKVGSANEPTSKPTKVCSIFTATTSHHLQLYSNSAKAALRLKRG
eukprot:CAMPEP_0204236574 /NCGR_PEP_ID=MMETSP0361-20130328/92583_1 /ASSEMBLY_ACC=CAM_ASM_000343 /TAXON_ID=268821 /ORGANISM="Scrippsiella Hangoei, Strain SHTV-5" /LENGTH=47 /DNA_ID= /DNA_START= /DNA_END= /DNA_ORIENTATION=